MQTLFPAAYPEGIQFVRTFVGLGTTHLGELPDNKGFSRIDGGAIASEDEIRSVIPVGPMLAKALDWWAHHEDEEPEWEPPAVTWKKGALVYVDSGAELTSHAEIIQAYPESSVFQKAALEWFASRQHAQYQSQQREDLQTGVRSGEPTPPPAPKKQSHHKKKDRMLPRGTENFRGSRIQQVMGTNGF